MLTLIEARPGAGKTTAIHRLADLLAERGVALAGFLTEEIRERGRRVGFAIATFDGDRGTLAHVPCRGRRRSAATASTWSSSSASRCPGSTRRPTSS